MPKPYCADVCTATRFDRTLIDRFLSYLAMGVISIVKHSIEDRSRAVSMTFEDDKTTLKISYGPAVVISGIAEVTISFVHQPWLAGPLVGDPARFRAMSDLATEMQAALRESANLPSEANVKAFLSTTKIQFAWLIEVPI